MSDKPVKSICVFCGSSTTVDKKYKDVTTTLGERFAKEDWTLVYGGAQVGLMGVIADAALAKGGQVVGVIPAFLKSREIAHSRLSMLHITETLHERQQKMADLADGFIILPGALGTLAEFFEALTWKDVGLHNKPIAVLNAYGFWDGLLGSIENCVEEGFLRQEDKDLFKVFDNVETLCTFFKAG